MFLPNGDSSRWLFPRQGQHPLHQNSVAYIWRKEKAIAGGEYRLHDLRHFYASGLIAASCDVVTVQRALGYSSATETLKTYAHLWPDASDRTRQAARQLYKQSTAYPLHTDSQEIAADLVF